MKNYFTDQFSLSTAEDERNYFTGATRACAPEERPVLAPGTYRVVNGTLCRVVAGVPPQIELTANSSRTQRR